MSVATYTLIPEEQLQTWARSADTQKAVTTNESIRNAIGDGRSLQGLRIDTYLQGSYGNSTNIRGDSDVDLVAQLDTVFVPDLSLLPMDDQLRFRCFHPDSPQVYPWKRFRGDLRQALVDYYGTTAVTNGSKCLTVAGNSSRLDADVVACVRYHRYLRYRTPQDQEFAEGILFENLRTGEQIVNFPKLHRQNGEAKNARTNGRFKPLVRVMKRLRNAAEKRGHLEEGDAPSYFLECFIYNAPDHLFVPRLTDTVLNILLWMAEAVRSGSAANLPCQNGVQPLFGESSTQWTVAGATRFVVGAMQTAMHWR